MAIKRWLGAAQDIQQHHTWTITGTWATGDTTTWTINDKSLILTLGTDVAVADVAAEIVAMINAASAAAGRVGTLDETRNFGGQEFPEWTEVVASSSGAVLTLKCTAGIPVTIAATENTAGTGAVGSATVVAAATGKNFFNDPANWSGGSLPVDDDILLFDQGSIDVKYGMENTGGSQIDDLSLIRTNGYSGNIGLPPIHGSGASAYVEYRPRYLHLPADGGTQGIQVGDQDSPIEAAGFTYIDLGLASSSSLQIYIYDAPPLSETDGYPVRFINGNPAQLNAYKGGVSVGNDSFGNPISLSSVNVYGTASVLIGDSSSLLANTTINQTGGDLICLGVSAGGTNPVATIYGGTARFEGVNLLSLSIHNEAVVVYEFGTVTTCTLYSGSTLNEGSLAATITNMIVYAGVTISHPNNKFTFTNGIDFYGCRPTDLNWTAPLHKTWTPSAI